MGARSLENNRFSSRTQRQRRFGRSDENRTKTKNIFRLSSGRGINYGLRNTQEHRFKKRKEFITTGRTHSFIETVNNNGSAPAGKRVRRDKER